MCLAHLLYLVSFALALLLVHVGRQSDSFLVETVACAERELLDVDCFIEVACLLVPMGDFNLAVEDDEAFLNLLVLPLDDEVSLYSQELGSNRVVHEQGLVAEGGQPTQREHDPALLVACGMDAFDKDHGVKPVLVKHKASHLVFILLDDLVVDALQKIATDVVIRQEP